MRSAISSYMTTLRSQPLRFQALDEQILQDGSRLSRYLLLSQGWPAGPAARDWWHQVDLVVPAEPRPGPALLLANNRSPYPHPAAADPRPAEADFDAANVAALLRHTGMSVVSVAQLPNQPLQLPGETEALSEDALVAACWRAFMASPEHDPTLPLQVPMTAAVLRTIDLWARLGGSERGLIVAGLSKRAGTAWLAAMNEPRVVALVSLGLDIRFQAVLGHIHAAYQGQWPEALAPYAQAGITESFRSPAFSQLMDVIDPWAQRNTVAGARLNLPKLVVNASGDDFFPPDCPALYVPDLPQPLLQLTLPNCDHAGIRRHVAGSLIPFVTRIAAGGALPSAPRLPQDLSAPQSVQLAGNESPRQAHWWQAHHPTRRDFRFNHGVRYQACPLPIEHGRVELPALPAARGWYASYLELHFADGLKLSSPVHIQQRP
ncbi:PhoPQ-activated protein PqaA family protein [Frateuria aurantia]